MQNTWADVVVDGPAPRNGVIRQSRLRLRPRPFVSSHLSLAAHQSRRPSHAKHGQNGAAKKKSTTCMQRAPVADVIFVDGLRCSVCTVFLSSIKCLCVESARKNDIDAAFLWSAAYSMVVPMVCLSLTSQNVMARRSHEQCARQLVPATATCSPPTLPYLPPACLPVSPLHSS